MKFCFSQWDVGSNFPFHCYKEPALQGQTRQPLPIICSPKDANYAVFGCVWGGVLVRSMAWRKASYRMMHVSHIWTRAFGRATHFTFHLFLQLGIVLLLAVPDSVDCLLLSATNTDCLGISETDQNSEQWGSVKKKEKKISQELNIDLPPGTGTLANLPFPPSQMNACYTYMFWDVLLI